MVTTNAAFDDLIDEGNSVDVTGWDFSWFEGRAIEARPPWGYQRLVASRLPEVKDLVDLQTGGGEVTAGALRMSGARPRSVFATESWEPNLTLARGVLAAWNGHVFGSSDDEIPLADTRVDFAISRHPVTTAWAEIARILRPGGTYLSQEVGRGSVRELTEAMIGPFRIGEARDPARARAAAEAAGLEVVRLETASLPMTFDDVAAVVVFLRKVIWIVPGFHRRGVPAAVAGAARPH